MKILLITAKHNIKERYGSKMNIRSGILPSLGIGLIGTIIKSLNHEVKYLDLAVLAYTDKELLNFIYSFKPDLIGMSSTSPYAKKSFSITKMIKNEFKDVPIIFGGTHITIFPEQSMAENASIDIGVIGEGEETIKELLSHFEGKKPLGEIQGIIYRKDDKLIRTPERKIIENLDSLPFIDRDIYDNKHYVPLPNQYKKLPLMNMVTSRGCPYKCAFCFEAGKFGQKHRRQSPRRVVDEITYMVDKFGIKEISFWDDNFLMPRNWIIEFCNLLKERKIDILWSCVTRVNETSPQLLKLIRLAGCYNIFFGLESGVQKLLDNLNKRTTVEQNRNAVKWSNEAGLEVRGSFMLAIPGETPELGLETIKFILSLDLHSLQISYTTPYWGTALYDLCKKSGRLIEDSDDYNVFNVVYVPEGYESAEQIYKLQKMAYRKFYFRPSYVFKQIRKIRSISDLKRYLDGFKFVLGISM